MFRIRQGFRFGVLDLAELTGKDSYFSAEFLQFYEVPLASSGWCLWRPYLDRSFASGS